MNGRRAIVGLCMLCALMVSAFAAQSASAATKGTTAFTCVKGAGTLRGEHCLTTGTAAPEYGHVAIKEPEGKETTTELEISSAKTDKETTAAGTTAFQETIAGAELELQSNNVTGTTVVDKEPAVTTVSSITNKKDPVTGEHYIEGTALYHYAEVKVTKPAGKGCKVFTDEEATKTKGAEGVVDVHLNFTTKGQGDFIKFEGATGTQFATFFIECTTKVGEALEGTWTITGSAKCPPTGATIVCSHTEITTQNTLKGKGSKAGLEGPLTISGRDPTLKETTYTPLSFTTVETP
jgi:hypothetical protein